MLSRQLSFESQRQLLVDDERKSRNNQTVAEFRILISSILYAGVTVGMRAAMIGETPIGPFTFTAARCIVSWVLLVAFKFALGNHIQSETPAAGRERSLSTVEQNYWRVILHGIAQGIATGGGQGALQIGLQTVDANKAGFFVASYVVIVPIVEWVIPGMGKLLTSGQLICAMGMGFGIYLLSGCAEEDVCFGGALGPGEGMVFVSLFFWVLQIFLCDFAAFSVDMIDVTVAGFGVQVVLFVALAAFLEPNDENVSRMAAVHAHWASLLLIGGGEALAFLLGMLGQMYVPPSRASILFCTESLFCAAVSWLVLGEHLTFLEMGGAAIMFCCCCYSSLSRGVIVEEGDRGEGEGEGDGGIRSGNGSGDLGDSDRYSCHVGSSGGYGSLSIDKETAKQTGSNKNITEKQPLFA
jgi:drug/metabolite transporter (DMT)-like permease